MATGYGCQWTKGVGCGIRGSIWYAIGVALDIALVGNSAGGLVGLAALDVGGGHIVVGRDGREMEKC